MIASRLLDKFKTPPMRHQLDCLNQFGRAKYFALAAEQGTGKTHVIINNMADLWASADLNGALVFAPNGVHYNWMLREIPLHMPDWVRFRVAAWNANPTRKDRMELDALFNETDSTVLRIFLMNVESLQNARGIQAAKEFARSSSKLMIVADESTAFKNPKAGRTKQLLKLKPYSAWRRIMNGALISQGPFDAFSQFMFLDESILGTTSYYAFKAEYAEMMEENHPLLRHIVNKKTAMSVEDREAIDVLLLQVLRLLNENGREDLIEMGGSIYMAFESSNFQLLLEANKELRGMLDPHSRSPRKLLCLQQLAQAEQIIGKHMAYVSRLAAVPGRLPQIVERDKKGRPKYRNLDKLSALIAPHTFRVLKKDCLDLPEKIYKFVWFDLTDQQQKVYKKAADQFRLELNGEDTPFAKLTAQMKLMQITSGYYLHPDAEEPVRLEGPNPKLEMLTERAVAIVEEGGKLIIWARFRVQIKDIVDALQKQGIEVVQYHGGVNKTDRVAAIESFERGSASVFVAQQQAGGRGLTLVAAANVFYFSNTYSLDDRSQSEDRAHRIGQDKDVVYTDFCARDTVDFECIEALRSKAEVAKEILAPLERIAAP